MSEKSGWIGVDLDATLAFYERWDGSIGLPVPEMAERVRHWLEEGREVRIVTARAHFWEVEPDRLPTVRGMVENEEKARLYERDVKPVEDWTERHLGRRLRITCMKDFRMAELWDDRAVTVEKNTGRVLTEGIEPPSHPLPKEGKGR